ncbi:MAG: trehalose-phosphatase [Aquamicrobium sp.]|nr:trehalose-phosphatase [Aquamicrobium sp.]
MPLPAPDFPADHLPPSRTAFFLDFDGTLAQIVADPDRAAVGAETLAVLRRLEEVAGGAVAVVSGRSIAQLDRMLHPLRLPAAGVHGLERRDAAGTLLQTPVDADAQQRLAAAVSAFVEGRPGLLAEVKPGSVALHYRKRPELEADSLAFAIDLARGDGRIRLVEGKKVIEMKLAARTKGDAIADFMAEAPFSGRLPFFAGDDVTDEAGFALVNGMGGVSLKVGPGETHARYRVADTAAFAACLARLAAG